MEHFGHRGSFFPQDQAISVKIHEGTFSIVASLNGDYRGRIVLESNKLKLLIMKDEISAPPGAIG